MRGITAARGASGESEQRLGHLTHVLETSLDVAAEEVREHMAALDGAGASAVPVRRARDLKGLDGIVLPGGESTTIDKLLRAFELFEPLRAEIASGLDNTVVINVSADLPFAQARFCGAENIKSIRTASGPVTPRIRTLLGTDVLDEDRATEEVRQVEAQQHEIENLQRRQRDQYLDLDRRLQALEQGATVSAGNAADARAQDAPVLRPVSDSAPLESIPADVPEVRAPIDASSEITPLARPSTAPARELDSVSEDEKAGYDRAFRALRP